MVDCFFYAFWTPLDEIAKYHLAKKVLFYPHVTVDPKDGPAITMKRSLRTWNEMDLQAMECSDTPACLLPDPPPDLPRYSQPDPSPNTPPDPSSNTPPPDSSPTPPDPITT